MRLSVPPSTRPLQFACFVSPLADRLRLVVPVPQAYLSSFSKGQRVEFTVPAYPSRQFSGVTATACLRPKLQPRLWPACARSTAFAGLELHKTEKTVRIEYDASRLTEPVIHQLLRRAGLDIVEEVPLTTPPVPDQPAS